MNYSFVFFLNSALLGVGLAMDAFSVSLANGLHEPKMRMKKMCGIAGTFGAFGAILCISSDDTGQDGRTCNDGSGTPVCGF